MRIVLVGADLEENLGLGMIGAVALRERHEVRVVPFNAAAEAPSVARTVLAAEPDVIGLSLQFQHRAHDFLMLARRLRRNGFEGHITCGGQFATLADRDVLEHGHGIDSIVLHDGELGFCELLRALASGRPLWEVDGIALLGAGGVAQRTRGRPLIADLDALPFPLRYRPHARHAGVPFVPIMGARGCWGRCSYCSISSFYRDARANGGGALLRLRSPASVASEMALLSKRVGGECIFCFHDDNFLLPKPAASLERVRAIRRELDRRSSATVALVGKCRPETLTTELARELAALGVIRLYVGVENAAANGAQHLARGKQHTAIDGALEACRNAGIFACYNLLLFEPEASLDDIRENVEFMRSHADHPVNFCRAEPYSGTPLMRELAAQDGLSGSYLGYSYRARDDRTELLFRICSSAFRERNFRADGVANRIMSVGYTLRVIERFHPDSVGRVLLARRASELTRAITRDTSELLLEALELVEQHGASDPDRIERETALLGLRIAAADRIWHRELDAFHADADELVERARRAVTRKGALAQAARRAALGASLVLGAAGCGCEGSTTDPVPSDGGMDAADSMVVDPAPPDTGLDQDSMVVDPLPEDSGYDDDSTVVDPAPPDAGVDGDMAALQPPRPAIVDQWCDSAPRRSLRSADLPLSDPPDVRLAAARDSDAIVVRLLGGPEALSVRWEADGALDGGEREIRWRPGAEDDLLAVAVRSRGGVSLLTLRARSVRQG
jgi:anaerobic magnesium-protoporphyrin IX monomethyl ester cyclase